MSDVSRQDTGKEQPWLVETQYYSFATPEDPFPLDCGKILEEVTLSYETYGDPANKDKSILILHALTGDAHAAGYHSPDDKKPGWWDIMIGPGKTFDTNEYFIICSNVIGGCQGSTGPASRNPRSGAPYGSKFPLLTIRDMVRAQVRLIDHLGIDRLLCVAGGSMGGMQALQWAVDFPDRILTAIPIATTAKHSAQSIAFYEVGRQAIITDPNWHGGDYYEHNVIPGQGLSLARMIAHITYLSDESMRQKFSRRLQENDGYHFSFEKEFQVESYLHHQGSTFIDRFDANSYLILTKAMDYFDISSRKESLVDALQSVKAKVLVISFSSDWHYPPGENKAIVNALRKNDVDVTYSEVSSPYGHDAFLLEDGKLSPLIEGFLKHL